MDKDAAVAEARRLMAEEGLSANKASDRVAVGLGVSGRTVKRWAAAAGAPLGDGTSQDTGKALAALTGYTAARRLGLADKLLARVDVLVDTAPAEVMQRLVMAFAVASDKRSQLEQTALLHAALQDPGYWGWLQGEVHRHYPDKSWFAQGISEDGAILGPATFFLARVAADQARQHHQEAERAEREARFAAGDDDEEEEEDDQDDDEGTAEDDPGGMSESEILQSLRRRIAALAEAQIPTPPRVADPALYVDPPPPPAPKTPAAESPVVKPEPVVLPEPEPEPEPPGIRWLDTPRIERMEHRRYGT